MSSRVVGLDIGTHAVRAVELSVGRGAPVLQRFGQVALPEGAVVAGEVVDPAAVTAAVKRLWRDGGFKAREVVVGVANQRVVARTVDVPAMPDDELRSALRFQVQDLIPIRVEEAVLDHQVLERMTGPDGEQLLRLLVVAAHQDMLRSLLAAVHHAGLRVIRVDLVPFALIRSLHDATAAASPAPPAAVAPVDAGTDDRGGDLDAGGDGDGDAPAAGSDGGHSTGGTVEAIVDVGAGVSTVVVHEAGVPTFVRSVPSGGETVTAALAERFGIAHDTAEALKRQPDVSGDADVERETSRVVAEHVGPLVEDLRGSLDFYLAQHDDIRLQRVLLTGGGARMPELADRLAGQLRVTVERGSPLAAIQLGNVGLPPGTIEASEDLLAVPVGLALGGDHADGAGVRRVNLLPSEVTKRQAERRQSAKALAGVGVLAVLLLGVWLARGTQVSAAGDEAADAEARTAQLEGEVAALGDVEALERQIAARRSLTHDVLAGEVAWGRLLREIAGALPDDVWLTSFTGRLDEEGGTVQVTARASDQTAVAGWLAGADGIPSLTELWLPTSTQSSSAGDAPVTFTSVARLTPAAGSGRAASFLEGER